MDFVLPLSIDSMDYAWFVLSCEVPVYQTPSTFNLLSVQTESDLKRLAEIKTNVFCYIDIKFVIQFRELLV